MQNILDGKPCYLIGEGYVNSFKELMETTEWDKCRPEIMTNVQIALGTLRL